MWKDVFLPLLFVVAAFAYMNYWVFTRFRFLLYKKPEEEEGGEENEPDERLASLLENIKRKRE